MTAIIAVVLGALCGEVLFGVLFWLKDGPELTRLEGVEDMPYFYYTETGATGPVNADGFYTSKERAKSPNVLRVVLLGGSVARSATVFEEQTLANHIEQQLRAELGDENIEVVNAAFDGYVLEQEFLLTQLVVQKYEPQIIIGLDGYNDLMSFKLNRYSKHLYMLPPQNWRDFLVITQGKQGQAPFHRLSVLFKNNVRAFAYLRRAAEGRSLYDYNSVTDDQLARFARMYGEILDDLHAFAAAKGIAYYGFLQPIRFYDSKGSAPYLRGTGIPQIAKLYYEMENVIRARPYTFSLTRALDGQMDVFVDDAHVVPRGNFILAKAMVGPLVHEIRSKWPPSSRAPAIVK